jgi:hypothetical protein
VPAVDAISSAGPERLIMRAVELLGGDNRAAFNLQTAPLADSQRE